MKIAHSADWHLMSMHLRTTERRADFLRAAKSATLKASEAGCAAILSCGDILDKKNPNSENIDDLAELDRYARELGIKILAVTGDHDKSEPTWLDLLKKFTGDGDETSGLICIDNRRYVLEHKGEKLTLVGRPFMEPEAFVDSLKNEERADVLVWHHMIKEFAHFPDAPGLNLDDAPLEKFRAFLLGDLHKRMYITHKSGCVVGYPGALETIKRDEPTEHSITVFDFNEKDLLSTAVEVQTWSRKVLLARLETDEQVQGLIKAITTLRDQKPLVFGRYSRSLDDVTGRVQRAVGPDSCYLRLQALPSVSIEGLFTKSGDVKPGKELTDFIVEFFPSGTLESETAKALCLDGADPMKILAAYEEKALAQITA